MRVLFTDHTTQPSGGQLALWRLISNLDQGLEVALAAPSDGPLYRSYLGLGWIDVYRWKLPTSSKRATGRGKPSLRGSVALLRAVVAAHRIVTAANPDIVHTNSIKALIAFGLAARLSKRKLVVHVRDRLARDYLSFPQYHLVRLLVWALPHGVIANSKTTMSLVPLRRRTSSRILPSPCVVCLQHHRTISDADSRLELVMMSRLVRWKGHEVALKAARLMLDRGVEEFHLTIYGDSLLDKEQYKTELHTIAEQLRLGDFVEFRNHVENVEQALLDADVLIHSSTLPEPFGQVVVEAMSCGLVVVASCAGGPAEIIEDGVTGLLIEPGDPEALALAIQALIVERERARDLGAQASTSVDQYRPRTVIATLKSFYSLLLEQEDHLPAELRKVMDVQHRQNSE